MGPALSTEEIRAWGPSRGLSKADTEQLIAVGVDRDKGWHEYHIAYSDFKKAKADMINELKGILEVLKNPGPASETLFMLAQRGTAKRIVALLERENATRNNDAG